MTYLVAAILGVVQGLTEFLPISSSAHLVIAHLWIGGPEPALAFDLALPLGTLVAVALVRQRFTGDKLVETFLVLPLTAPEVVMGASLLTLFLDLGWNRGFGTIVIAHIGFEVSFVAMTVKARLRGFDWTLEDAAMDLGASPTRTFLRVTLPLIVPGVVAAAMLSFALSLDDFVITFFTAGVGASTLPLQIYTMVKISVTPEVNAVSTLLMLLTLALILIASRLSPGALRGR